MDDVNVHYNSEKPAQLNAHAYAQGTNIYLASGQEKHLPHEAWHIVQQKQGRVKPVFQIKGKIMVNDGKTLEREAGLMGNKALQSARIQKKMVPGRKHQATLRTTTIRALPIVQRYLDVRTAIYKHANESKFKLFRKKYIKIFHDFQVFLSDINSTKPHLDKLNGLMDLNSNLPIFYAVLWVLFTLPLPAQPARLIVRVDDMGCSQATNEGILKAFRDGIATSVEVMAPTPWFPQAVRLLRENPDIDAGIHLTLTSEWSDVKWRPLTKAPGLSDEWGYFYPIIWPNERFGAGRAIIEHEWTLAEVEAELRAQIELAKREIPRLSHVSGHMGCTNLSDEVQALVRRLCDEYGLAIFPEDLGVERFPDGLGGARLSPAEKTANFIAGLRRLEPGKTYLFVEHPALDTPEQQAIGHPGYEEVAYDRMGVLAVLTSPEVKQMIKELGIDLISYKDLKN